MTSFNFEFPKNPSNGEIFEPIPGLFYKYNAGINTWVRVDSNDLELATTLVDGLMSAEDLVKINSLVVPPPQTSLKGEDCDLTFRGGTIAIYSTDKSLMITPSADLYDAEGNKIQTVNYDLHENTAGYDFRLNLERLISRIDELGKIKRTLVAGDDGPQGLIGDDGEDQIDTGPIGEVGDDGANSPFAGVAQPEPLGFQPEAELANRAIVDITTEQVSEDENYLVVTRANIGNPEACPSLIKPKDFSSPWLLVIDKQENQITRRLEATDDCTLTCKICVSSLYYLDVDNILNAIHNRFEIKLQELKKNKELIVRSWLKTMAEIFNQQKYALCCALENCTSKKRNTETRRYIEQSRIAAAQANYSLVINSDDGDKEFVYPRDSACKVSNKDLSEGFAVLGGENNTAIYCTECDEPAVIAKLYAFFHNVDPSNNEDSDRFVNVTLPPGDYYVQVTDCCANLDKDPKTNPSSLIGKNAPGVTTRTGSLDNLFASGQATNAEVAEVVNGDVTLNNLTRRAGDPNFSFNSSSSYTAFVSLRLYPEGDSKFANRIEYEIRITGGGGRGWNSAVKPYYNKDNPTITAFRFETNQSFRGPDDTTQNSFREFEGKFFGLEDVASENFARIAIDKATLNMGESGEIGSTLFELQQSATQRVDDISKTFTLPYTVTSVPVQQIQRIRQSLQGSTIDFNNPAVRQPALRNLVIQNSANIANYFQFVNATSYTAALSALAALEVNTTQVNVELEVVRADATGLIIKPISSSVANAALEEQIRREIGIDRTRINPIGEEAIRQRFANRYNNTGNAQESALQQLRKAGIKAEGPISWDRVPALTQKKLKVAFGILPPEEVFKSNDIFYVGVTEPLTQEQITSWYNGEIYFSATSNRSAVANMSSEIRLQVTPSIEKIRGGELVNQNKDALFADPTPPVQGFYLESGKRLGGFLAGKVDRGELIPVANKEILLKALRLYGFTSTGNRYFSEDQLSNRLTLGGPYQIINPTTVTGFVDSAGRLVAGAPGTADSNKFVEVYGRYNAINLDGPGWFLDPNGKPICFNSDPGTGLRAGEENPVVPGEFGNSTSPITNGDCFTKVELPDDPCAGKLDITPKEEKGRWTGAAAIQYNALLPTNDDGVVRAEKRITTVNDFGEFDTLEEAKRWYMNQSVLIRHAGGEVKCWIPDTDNFNTNNDGGVALSFRSRTCVEQGSDEGGFVTSGGVPTVYIYRNTLDPLNLMGAIFPYFDDDITHHENYGFDGGSANVQVGPELETNQGKVFFMLAKDGFAFYLANNKKVETGDSDEEVCSGRAQATITVEGNSTETEVLAINDPDEVSRRVFVGGEEYDVDFNLGSQTNGIVIGKLDLDQESNWVVIMDEMQFNGMNKLTAHGSKPLSPIYNPEVYSPRGVAAIDQHVLAQGSYDSEILEQQEDINFLLCRALSRSCNVETGFGGRTSLGVTNRVAGTNFRINKPLDYTTESYSTLPSTYAPQPEDCGTVLGNVEYQVLTGDDGSFRRINRDFEQNLDQTKVQVAFVYMGGRIEDPDSEAGTNAIPKSGDPESGVVNTSCIDVCTDYALPPGGLDSYDQAVKARLDDMMMFRQRLNGEIETYKLPKELRVGFEDGTVREVRSTNSDGNQEAAQFTQVGLEQTLLDAGFEEVEFANVVFGVETTEDFGIFSEGTEQAAKAPSEPATIAGDPIILKRFGEEPDYTVDVITEQTDPVTGDVIEVTDVVAVPKNFVGGYNPFDDNLIDPKDNPDFIHRGFNRISSLDETSSVIKFINDPVGPKSFKQKQEVDTPGYWAIQHAAESLDWDSDARKAIVVVGNDGSRIRNGITEETVLNALREKGIMLFSVSESDEFVGLDDPNSLVLDENGVAQTVDRKNYYPDNSGYKNLAEATGGIEFSYNQMRAQLGMASYITNGIPSEIGNPVEGPVIRDDGLILVQYTPGEDVAVPNDRFSTWYEDFRIRFTEAIAYPSALIRGTCGQAILLSDDSEIAGGPAENYISTAGVKITEELLNADVVGVTASVIGLPNLMIKPVLFDKNNHGVALKSQSMPPVTAMWNRYTWNIEDVDRYLDFNSESQPAVLNSIKVNQLGSIGFEFVNPPTGNIAYFGEVNLIVRKNILSETGEISSQETVRVDVSNFESFGATVNEPGEIPHVVYAGGIPTEEDFSAYLENFWTISAGIDTDRKTNPDRLKEYCGECVAVDTQLVSGVTGSNNNGISTGSLTVQQIECAAIDIAQNVPLTRYIFTTLGLEDSCLMAHTQIRWYERGWRTKACCGAYVEIDGQQWIVVKRSIGADDSCGGGESMTTECIKRFINNGEGHPAIAYPTVDGEEFIGIPNTGSQRFIKSPALSVAILKQIQSGNADELRGNLTTQNVTDTIPFILFPSSVAAQNIGSL